jgi:hypothetical protein
MRSILKRLFGVGRESHLYTKIIRLSAIAALLAILSHQASAETIKIGGYSNGPRLEYVFGDYKFEVVNRSGNPGIQYNSLYSGSEYGSIVSAKSYAGDYTMSRVDGESFSLLYAEISGNNSSARIGNFSITNYRGRQYLDLAGYSDLTDVTSITFSPTANYLTLYEFEATTVPIPAAVWLFGSALAGLGWLRRKQTV